MQKLETNEHKKRTFELNIKEFEEFKIICKINNSDSSKIIRTLIKKYIEEYKKNNKNT